MTINGRQQYLWRTVDEDGDVLDILVQSRRNRRAAVRFFRKLLKKQGRLSRRLITHKLRSYAAACRTVMPSTVHYTDQYVNNRAEVSHQPTRQRERQMRRFKSPAHLQHFGSGHGVVHNLFRGGRHLLRGAPQPAPKPSLCRVGRGDVRLLNHGSGLGFDRRDVRIRTQCPGDAGRTRNAATHVP